MWRLFLLIPLSSLFAEISALYLSWYGDPTTTMTIQWHTTVEELDNTIQLQNREGDWAHFQGEHTALSDLLIHKVSLSQLSPDQEYSFRIGQDPTTYRFRTAPSTLDKPIRFVIGGDVYASKKLFRRMAKTVVENDPLFAVLGGDIAYAINYNPLQSSGLRRWKSFLKDWKELLITQEKRVIPFLIVPGNHDITPDNYTLFFQLFAFPQKKLYRAIDFGSYLTLFLLDTGHFQPIDGQQPYWLEKALSSRTQILYQFAVYHEGAYPSYYSYEGSTPQKIRAHWVPLFEKYRLQAAFENHNHAYKKTYPIKANHKSPDGVVYIGDGAWGAPPRNTKEQWYLEQRARKNNILLISLSKEQAAVQALDLLNQPLDETTLYPH